MHLASASCAGDGDGHERGDVESNESEGQSFAACPIAGLAWLGSLRVELETARKRSWRPTVRRAIGCAALHCREGSARHSRSGPCDHRFLLSVWFPARSCDWSLAESTNEHRPLRDLKLIAAASFAPRDEASGEN